MFFFSSSASWCIIVLLFFTAEIKFLLCYINRQTASAFSSASLPEGGATSSSLGQMMRCCQRFFFNCLLTCQRCWSNYSFACLERSCSSFFLLLLECITAVLWKLFDGPGESSRSSCRAGFSFYTTLYSAVTVYALMYQCMNKGNLRSLSPKSSSLIFDELKLHSLLNCQ